MCVKVGPNQNVWSSAWGNTKIFGLQILKYLPFINYKGDFEFQIHKFEGLPGVFQFVYLKYIKFAYRPRLENAVLLYFFSNFTWKTPTAVIPIFGPKTQFYQNYSILWAKKVKRMPFMGERMGSKTDWGGVGSKAISSNFLKFYNLWVTRGSCPHIL